MRRKWLLSAAVILAGGCGGPGGWFELPASPQTGGDMFVLDWTGGSSPLWKDGDLPPLDLADFRTPGETLADAPDSRRRCSSGLGRYWAPRRSACSSPKASSSARTRCTSRP